MKRYDFNSSEAFEESNLPCEDNVVVAITEDGWFKADLMTACKRWKTAVNRFFAACPEIAHWKEEVIESIESGYWKSNDVRFANGMLNPFYSFSWEVEEEDDGLWYIFLNEKTNRWS